MGAYLGLMAARQIKGGENEFIMAPGDTSLAWHQVLGIEAFFTTIFVGSIFFIKYS